MQAGATDYDVIIIGGGPAGSAAGITLARAGKRVLIVEKATHPRFHIGESFLPQNLSLIKELGLIEKFRAITHVTKWGAEFGFGHSSDPETSRFHFRDTLQEGPRETYNIERAPYDAMLLEAAAESGATVKQDTRVDQILRLAEQDVAIRCGETTLTARWLIDASGTATVVGRHLGTRKTVPWLENVAYFGHFKNVKRLEGEEAGHPTITMCDEGWFWAIPIKPDVTSCGLVIHRGTAKRVQEEFGVASDQMLRWGIDRCPLMKRRCADAIFPEKNGTIADFTYRCEPYAGPGYFLVGDAATFIDPIFSTGTCLGMMYAVNAAEWLIAADEGRANPDKARAGYIRYVKQSSKLIFRLVRHYYKHSFRELMMNQKGPVQINKAVISMLAGHVFPRPSWSLTWRFWFFEACIALQKWIRLVPRHPQFSLASQPRTTDSLGPADEIPETAAAR